MATNAPAINNNGLPFRVRKKAKYQPGSPFVPPSLLATLSGVLSRHVFHDRLEMIHCDRSLYPHHEESTYETMFEVETVEEEVDCMEWIISEIESMVEPRNPTFVSQRPKPETRPYRVQPNRGRLSSSRWSYAYEAQIYFEDYEWDESDEIGGWSILAGSCMAAAGLVVLSLWAITTGMGD